MLAKFTALFTMITIFFQMLAGGYPIAGGSSAELKNYEVSGSIAEGAQVYTFKKPDKTAFNKFTLSYDSNSYLHGTISYTYQYKNYTEDFYMEPGRDAAYTSFIDSYLRYGCGKSITKLTVEAVEGENPTFTLKSFTTEVAEVYSDLVYIESDRYKLAASLNWGGALAYFEDFKDNDSDLTNLINWADAGRLVQQSYYGTINPPYEPEIAGIMNYEWPYNPVQGGNQYDERSKIIDIQKTDTTLYIKSRAREWAKHDFSYCYMENTYMILDTHVEVDNRFVDYAPFTHPITDQECPAFYTVSHLSRYVSYEGADSWTGDSLTYRDDLEFWGNPDVPRVYRYFPSSDYETWSAFVNAEDWGFGVFAPTAYRILAGRAGTGGTKDSKGSDTSYISPLARFAIVRCEPMTYTYFMATGTTAEMRSLFHSLKDTTSNQLFG